MLQVKFLTAIQEKDQRGLLENVNFTLGPGDKAVIIGEEGKQPVYEFCAGAVSHDRKRIERVFSRRYTLCARGLEEERGPG